MPVNEGGDVRPCVTYLEFRHAHIDMPQRRIERIFDTHGRRARRSLLTQYGFPGEQLPIRHRLVRVYPACPTENAGEGVVVIEYDRQTRDHRMQSGFY